MNQVFLLVEKIVCDAYSIKPAEARLKTRQSTYLRPRQVIISILADITNIRTSAIMVWFEQDRTNFYNCKKSTQDLCDTNKKFSNNYANLKSEAILKIKASGYSDVLYLNRA